MEHEPINSREAAPESAADAAEEKAAEEVSAEELGLIEVEQRKAAEQLVMAIADMPRMVTNLIMAALHFPGLPTEDKKRLETLGKQMGDIYKDYEEEVHYKKAA